ncbi:arsenate reductase [Labrenzia sp. EL_208]|uniref:Arsenate reductase n=1 Tax=Roseibium album TaxID=311410 RepID=A0A0M7A9P5_9HYPH|nr:arsenate reductase ArsC [Roseibium album]MBG6175705.1 arsenate reductase [Labrenzia sp. EL_132]MBG6204597.1 arsenate reductase [Labrenzia sp. EL_13]MBG6230534.1 arsenate reductase [Labrenzia sp. EL_208]CTQ57511.1 Arsenate reductase [Roseibium album]CTQ69196.1 Arsenate reductase [Roseibium album]
MRNALILCTANSARSVLGEALLRHLGQGRFAAFSAGSTPRGSVNPDALACLERRGLSTEGFRSKSWEEFAGVDAPAMDLIITVCDSAAGEACPVWPGHPMVVHWGIPDPASVEGDDATRGAAFDLAYQRLERRINDMLALGDEVFEAEDGKSRLAAIGTSFN